MTLVKARVTLTSCSETNKQPTQVKFAQWTDDTEWYDTSEGEGDQDELLGDYDWDPDGDQDFH